MNEKRQKPHHHGDLKEALITAGIELLDEGGLHNLTLRKCAAKVKVSHAAPAHHFSGLQGLVAAICQRARALFALSMQQEINKANEDPFDILRAMCHGYLLFAMENHALAQLMFNQRNDMVKESGNGRSNDDAFNILIRTCAPFKLPDSLLKIESTEKKQETRIQFVVWSLIHGYTQLCQLGQINKSSEDSPLIDFSDMLSMLKLELKE